MFLIEDPDVLSNLVLCPETGLRYARGDFKTRLESGVSLSFVCDESLNGTKEAGSCKKSSKITGSCCIIEERPCWCIFVSKSDL